MGATGTNVYINSEFFDDTCKLEFDRNFINVENLTEIYTKKGSLQLRIYVKKKLEFKRGEEISISFNVAGIKITTKGKILNDHEIYIDGKITEE